jgi:hypothetical protein
MEVRIMRALLAGLLLIAGCRASGPRSLDSIDPLRERFGAHPDRVRFIALLSPT